MVYADCIVDISHESIDRTFQYRIPESLQQSVHIGTRVNIPFGNRREMTGYVVGLSNNAKIPEEKLRDILGISEKSVSIGERQILLAAWIKANYGGTMNDALKTVLPVKKTVKPSVRKEIVLACEKEYAVEALKEAEKKHFVARVRLISELLENPVLPYELVGSKLNISKSTISGLEKNGILTVNEERIDRGRKNIPKNHDCGVKLNEQQSTVVETVCAGLDSGKNGKYLVHGVTGSGKTEVYMEIIDHVVGKGKQVIVLIPEISLTYQTVLRFSKRFGNRVAFFNSRLSDGEKFDQYEKAKEGLIDIMIGPRSALFTPFNRLGLVVIDEEHEGAYKSEGTPKYHAREVAERLCEMTGAALVLGSATPSLESFLKAKKGEYKLFTIDKRAKASAVMPDVEIVDLSEELKNKNRSIFSFSLVDKMKTRLEKHEQIILFLNRRGYSGFVSCRSCGEAINCPHCSVSLTQHRDGSLKCHYCGYETRMPNVCPKCGSKYIASFGTGTQKIEESVKKLFPSARVLRMDADTTTTKESYEDILSAFANEEADILIGTQMIVKGHDFPKVTLVGILAADLSLHVSDYRAAEKTFQLLAQAAGRAGRASLHGDVVIQTYKPDHYVIQCAAKQDYYSFYEQEIKNRELLSYPPVSHILAIVFSGRSDSDTKGFSEYVSNSLVDKFVKSKDNNNLRILGPNPCGVLKINDIYRYAVYVKTGDVDIIKGIVESLEGIKEKAAEKKIMIQTDFDPMNSY